MSMSLKISGMVLSTMPMGEYDRRIVLLTSDRGKIDGFARGVRKPGSSMMAAAQPFVYAEFTAVEGRSSYIFIGAKVYDYFSELRQDIDAFIYGSYFLELADFFARENEDDYDILALLYLSVKALIRKKVPARLIRCVYELRMLKINGIYPQFFRCMECGKEDDLIVFSVPKHGMLCSEHASYAGEGALRMGPAALYAAQFIISRPLKELFSFTISDEALSQLRVMLDRYMRTVIDKEFKSLEMLMITEGMQK